MAWQGSQSEDIRATLAVSQEEARLGGRRVITLPGRRTVTVTVPPGVRDGEELRLPGQGMMSAARGVAGDLILRVSIVAMNRLGDDAYPASATQTVYTSPPPLPPASRASVVDGTGYSYSTLPYEPPPAPSYPAHAIDGNYAPSAYSPVSNGPQSYPGFGAHPAYGQMAQPEQFFPAQTNPTASPQYIPQTPRKRGGVRVALILMVVLLVLLSSSLFFYLGYYQPAQLQIAGTATAETQALGTANAHATSTAHVTQAAATSTAQVQATAQVYQNLYAQSTSGTPTLNDSLNGQTGNQWDTVSGANGSCTFSGGSYHSATPNAGFFQPCYAENSNFSNFAFQVAMTIGQGDEGGIIFRADNVNDKFYLFRMNVNGDYVLYLYSNNQGSQALLLMSGTTHLMKPAGQSNTVTLVAQNGNLSFYLNQQYLNSKTDTIYSAGKIGVFAESAPRATDVAFSNAQVWTL